MKDRITSGKTYRAKQRKEAEALGLSVKSYRAQRYPSAGWTYMAEVVRNRCRTNGTEFSITAADLRAQHELQKGVCPITGWELEPKKSGSGLVPRTMTVDRKNPNLGYISTNIQLVCFIANNAKYIWPTEQLIEFCRAVLTQWGPTTADVIRAEEL